MSVTVAEINKTFVLPSSKKNGGKEIFYPESDGKPMAETDVHRELMSTLIASLKAFFDDRNDVYVTGNIMFYYEEGNPRTSISPDVMIVKGVQKKLRRTFRLWEENVPDVIFELSSRKTRNADFEKKYLLYEGFGVKEYYIFDPEYRYLSKEPLFAFHSKNKLFKKMKVETGKIFSPSLNLDIVNTSETLRLFNPETKEFLPTMKELIRQATKVETLESEIERLKAELAKRKRQN